LRALGARLLNTGLWDTRLFDTRLLSTRLLHTRLLHALSIIVALAWRGPLRSWLTMNRFPCLLLFALSK
jgi:hypothetical protein